MVTELIRPNNYNPGRSQKLVKLKKSSCRWSQLECNEESDETDDDFSVIVTVCRGPCALSIYSTHGTPSFMHHYGFKKGIRAVSCPYPTPIKVMKLKVILPYIPHSCL